MLTSLFFESFLNEIFSVFDENLNISIPIDNLQFMASTVNRVVFLSNDKRVLELELKECYEKEVNRHNLVA